MTQLERMKQIIMTRIQFNLECRADCRLEKEKRETSYHFYTRAQEDFELLDEIELLINEEKKKAEEK